jgi:endonuclease-3
MFYFRRMQRRFDFGGADITRWRERLKPMLDGVDMIPPRPPTGQLIKSMISSRTYDEVSTAAYDRLKAAYGSAAQLLAASPVAVQHIIEDVTFADKKAVQVIEALRLIRRRRGDLRLFFLGDLPIDAALLWLEDLPGVGRKVAASVLNASTLDRPVFIVDSHVMRVLGRLGFIDPDSEPRVASESVTTTMQEWTAPHFLQFHIQMKRLGQIHCHFEKPKCDMCPLAGECLELRQSSRPARASGRRPRPEVLGGQMSIPL